MPLGLWREPGQSIPSELLYRTARFVVLVLCAFLYRLRVFHADRVPPHGGLLVIANHTSHLDPPLVGVAIRGRSMRAMARSGLFRHKPFAVFIGAVGAIPLREGESDVQAMKKAITELERGRVVVIFPEGTRSPDGELRDFKRGCWLLVRRAKCDVLPMAIQGAFETWPRSATLPGLGAPRGGIGVEVGEVIRYSELEPMEAQEGLAFLRSRIGALQVDLRTRMHAASRRAAWGA
jgi:1-acyl-sn-glycerol-3-phosphate acyltransferase